MTLIYKIATSDEWRAAQASGRYEGAPIDIADGFIHFSTAEQASETAAKHFAGRSGLVLVALDAGQPWRQAEVGALARRAIVSPSLPSASW